MKKRFLVWILSCCVLLIAGCQQGGTDSFYEADMAGFLSQFRLPDTSITGLSEEVCILDSEMVFDETLIEAEGAGLFNESTKEVLYLKNGTKRIYPASLTKLMTALMTIEYYSDLDTLVTVTSDAFYGLNATASLAGLVEGCSYSVRDLLYALMVPSGNDAANVLAFSIAGTQEAFVEMMNVRAAELGMVNTHFVNPHGLHDTKHYTTVYDLYLLTRACLSHVQIAGIAGARDASITAHRADGTTFSKSFNSTNSYLLGYTVAPMGLSVRFGKTGFTNTAGRCLIMVCKNPQSEYIISIVVKADTYDHLYQEMNTVLELAVK